MSSENNAQLSLSSSNLVFSFVASQDRAFVSICINHTNMLRPVVYLVELVLILRSILNFQFIDKVFQDRWVQYVFDIIFLMIWRILPNWVPPCIFWHSEMIIELGESSVYAWAMMLSEIYQVCYFSESLRQYFILISSQNDMLIELIAVLSTR